MYDTENGRKEEEERKQNEIVYSNIKRINWSGWKDPNSSF